MVKYNVKLHKVTIIMVFMEITAEKL